MVDVEPHEFTFRDGTLQVIPQDFQFFRAVQILLRSKIVGHDEAAAPDVLAEIRDLLSVKTMNPGSERYRKGYLNISSLSSRTIL